MDGIISLGDESVLIGDPSWTMRYFAATCETEIAERIFEIGKFHFDQQRLSMQKVPKSAIFEYVSHDTEVSHREGTPINTINEATGTIGFPSQGPSKNS